ncbi:E3 ubiquitin-protein ligase TRIM71-like [Porites lutea]|uniref:E3 ubiquitin-protein ligase TRIM71-like n=1 Tax=Porites lutea TaxID=51062 RepID=UPI003CC555FC
MDVQQLFRNLQKEAECPLCLETVNNPKTLPCLHSFCLECLDKHAGFARRQMQVTIKCPVCQTSFQIPEGDSFKNLPTSYHLNQLVDVLALKDRGAQAQKCGSCDENSTASLYCFVCQNFLCTPCFEAHQRLKATRGHRNVVVEKLQAQDVEDLIHRPVMCSQQYHENQPLEFYCEECKVLICHKCSTHTTVVSHNRHTMTDTQKAAQVQKMQMMDALEKVKAETVVYEKKVRKQTELMDKNKEEIMSCEKKMTDLVEDLIRDLREHERIMKTKFAEIYEAQEKHHATQVENFELVLTQLKSCVERGETIVQRNISAEILQTNQAIVKRCEELLKARKPDIYKPSHVNYMVEQKVKILDRIVVSDTDPSLSLAEVASLKDVREKLETNFTIVTRNSDEGQCYQEEDVITVNILNPAGDQLETEIKDAKDGKYTVTYTPQCVGQHRVEIQVNGQPLTGSPWVVQVIGPHQYQFAFQFGSYGKEQGQFNYPWGIAVNDKSRILAVADYNNQRIQMFGFKGDFLREFALKGKPFSLAFTESGDLLVRLTYDKSTTKNLLFTENGQFIKYIGGEHIKTPYYVSVSSDGRIITSDSNDKTIKVLTGDGKNLLQSFKAPDCDETPDCVVYQQDKFVASFSSACRVMVFNNAGEYVHDIGSKGSGDGQFSEPRSVVIDKFNRLIVCNSGGKRRLQLFTLDGKYIAQIAGSIFENRHPCYAVISNTGHLFVTDSRRHCVYVFH